MGDLNDFIDSLPPRVRKKYRNMAVDLMTIHKLPPSFVADYLKDWADESTWEPIIEFRKIMRLNRIAQGAREYPCVKALFERGFGSHMRGHRNILLYNMLQILRRLRLPYTLKDILEMNKQSASPLPQVEVERTYYYHMKDRQSKKPYAFQCRSFQEVRLCDENCWRYKR